MNSSAFSSLLPLCTEMDGAIKNSAFFLIIHIQLIIISITLLSMAFLVRKFYKKRILMHGNLLFLFINILAILFLFTLGQFVYLARYRFILSFLSNDPCQLLTPLWIVCCFFGPSYAHSIAYPSFHFCIMIERYRATVLAEKYEREGQKLGYWMAIGIWSISILYTVFVIWSAWMEPKMAIQGLIYLTSKRSGQLAIYINYFALFFVIFTAICDWRITKMNQRIRQSLSRAIVYSLSRNYQLNENSLTMRLIFPLDMAYALIYSVFTVLVILNRTYKNSQQINIIQYTIYYAFINTLIYIYCALTIFVYIRFIAFVSSAKKRNVQKMRPSIPEGKIYFRQLEEQWQ